MLFVPLFLLAAFGGYLIGSIPWAFILVRLRANRDIRKEGSGNVGTLNSFVVTGSKRVGVAVLLLDLAKGFGAYCFGRLLGGEEFLAPAVATLGAVLGHNYPVWLRFKGGRGLAPAAGGMLGIAWMVVPAWCLLWGISILFLRSINPASAAACAVIALAALLLPGEILQAVSGPGETGLFRLFILFLMLALLARLVGECREYVAGRRKRRAAEVGR